MQLLRAPTLLRDYYDLENKIGSRLRHEAWAGAQFLPPTMQRWCYRFGFDRGFMDVALEKYVAGPFLRLAVRLDSAERRITDILSNEPSRESDQAELHPEDIRGVA